MIVESNFGYNDVIKLHLYLESEDFGWISEPPFPPSLKDVESNNFDEVKITFITRAELEHFIKLLKNFDNLSDLENFALNTDDVNKLKSLPDYHFDRDDFCKILYEVFSINEWFEIESNIQGSLYTDEFHLFYDQDTFYILHKESGVCISYYKHIGRCNTCNRSDFTLNDFKVFLKLLRNDLEYLGIVNRKEIDKNE